VPGWRLIPPPATGTGPERRLSGCPAGACGRSPRDTASAPGAAGQHHRPEASPTSSRQLRQGVYAPGFTSSAWRRTPYQRPPGSRRHHSESRVAMSPPTAAMLPLCDGVATCLCVVHVTVRHPAHSPARDPTCLLAGDSTDDVTLSSSFAMNDMITVHKSFNAGRIDCPTDDLCQPTTSE
jgi:hypothetical protein